MQHVRIINADVLEGLARLEDESVNCVVTSPPYWGLRDYGTAEWEGGDPECDHDQRRREKDPLSKSATSAGQTRDSLAGRNTCRKCGAVRIDKQIGLELTPAEYVARMVDVFREVRRVLRKDGTLWLNLGDSYAANGVSGLDVQGATSTVGKANPRSHQKKHVPTGLKPKDLVGIPWRVAFALQADGWYLRSDIIWHKPNPMPESVTDRPTKSHEYIFLMAKSAKYSYSADAIAEPAIHAGATVVLGDKSLSRGQARGAGVAPSRNALAESVVVKDTRNARSVWTITTKSYKAAHFATFPEALAERCIKAGCPEGGTVLDPFGGAGTTGLVAAKLRRDAVLIELNPEYARLAEDRIAGELPLMAEVTVE